MIIHVLVFHISKKFSFLYELNTALHSTINPPNSQRTDCHSIKSREKKPDVSVNVIPVLVETVTLELEISYFYYRESVKHPIT